MSKNLAWFADQSRYMQGYNCPFSRLLKYHLDGTGYVLSVEPTETKVGHEIHAGLEQVLLLAKSGTPVDKATITKLLTGPQDFESYGLVHAWTRAILPWLLASFEIVSAEEEFTIDIGDDIFWMARPDAIVRSKTTGKLSIVEFKSTRSKAERIARLHAGSLQSVMNAYAVSSKYGEAVESVQVHMLQLGVEKWPTVITHAYYRPAQPPYVSEDWQPSSRRPDGTWLGKLYRRVQVAQHRRTDDWIWSMPPGPLAEVVPVLKNDLDPNTQGLKVIQALQSIEKNESHWRSLLAPLDWSTTSLSDLSRLVPRTFNCQQYDRTCEFATACFAPALQSEPGALRALMGLKPRTPHHPQENK